jgi:glycerol-3-phosphate acyltransferase PlsY
MDTQTVILVITISYMLGSFPTAYIAGRLNGINIFDHGSGNMGATNVLRTLGMFWAVTVLLVDFSKGIVAVLIARELAPADPLSTQASASVVAALAAVIGHNWSVIASLISGSIRGGKGAATAGGTWLILMPMLVIIVPIFVVVVIAVTTRYMSLAVMTAATIGAILVGVLVFTHDLEPIYLLYTLIAALIVFRHRENIKRLLAGNERRIGEKASNPNQ